MNVHRFQMRCLLAGVLMLACWASPLWAQVSGTQIQRVRLTDGTRELTTLFDADSGAGTQWLQGVLVRMSASGGSVEVFRAEDSGHTSGDPGLMIFCVRNDAATVLAGTTLDYIPCTTNASGQLLVALPVGAAATQVQGTADDGAPEIGNPVQIGGVDAGGLMQAILVGTDGRFDMNLGQVSGTTLLTGNGVTGAGSPRVTIASDNTAFTVNVGTFPDNEPFNVAQFGGAAVVTGTGAGGAGIPRVTISNDSSLAANQSVNVSQINGVTPLMGNGITGTGSPRVTIASDNTAFTVNIGTFPDNEPFNVAQFGGSAVVTGAGAGGAGIPRVTVSSDSSLAANQSVNVSQINGVTPLMGNGLTGTGSPRVTIASDNTAFSVNIGTFPDNEPFNVAQFGGSAVVTGTGVGGAGIPRVTISNDSALAANQSVNVSQINGVTPLMGAGVTGTGSPRVSLATDANTIQISQTTPATTNGVTPVPSSNAGAANALTSSGAAEASNVLKASAGNLYSLTITTGATAGFLMMFNATSAPIDGAVTPAYCAQVPANMTSAFEWSIPVRFGTGVTAVFSSTGCFTKTASATAAFFAQVN